MTLRIRMPVVAPPSSGQTYGDLLQGQHFEVVEDPDSGSKGLRITHDAVSSAGASPFPLRAMAKGRVAYVPAGQTLTVVPAPGDLQIAAPSDAGTLFLKMLPAEVTHVASHLRPIGVAPYAHVAYHHVDEQSVETRFRQLVDQHVADGTLPRSELERVAGTSGAPLSDLKDDYLAAFMNGQTSIFVPSGRELGAQAPVDPGDPASQLSCTLRFYSDKLEEEAPSGTGTVTHSPEEVSPVLPLRNPPGYSDRSSTETDVWDGHPLIAQLRDHTVPFEAHLRFVISDVTTRPPEHVGLPQGVEVALMVDDLGSDTEVAVETTDGDGAVSFQIPDLEAEAGTDPDIYFLVRTNGPQHAGHTLPAEWSTQGWLAVDDETPGSYTGFAGSRIGFANDPAVFHVGVEVHLACRYEVDSSDHDVSSVSMSGSGSVDLFPFPEGTQLDVAWDAGFVSDPSSSERADENGEIHTVLFDISGTNTVYIDTDFEIEDPSVNLPRALVVDPSVVSTSPPFILDADKPFAWDSTTDDGDQFRNPLQKKTHVGSPSSAQVLDLGEAPRPAALYMLKNLREWSVALHHLTGGAWGGVQDLHISLWAPAAAFSWPEGRINIPESSHWARDTHVHELSHQVVWERTDLGTVNVGLRFAPPAPPDPGVADEYGMYHWGRMFANPGHAFVEGWPAFVESLFQDTNTDLPTAPRRADEPLEVAEISSVTRELTGTPNEGRDLGPDASSPRHFDTGFSVEGAFTNALYLLFRDAIDGVSGVPGRKDSMIPETEDGTLASAAGWITDPTARQRFTDFIFRTLDQLPDDEPTTAKYLNEVETAVSGDPGVSWPRLLADVRIFNMFVDRPRVTGVQPAGGPVAGGQTITVQGDFFLNNRPYTGLTTRANTEVEIGGQPASALTVVDTNTLEVTTPGVPTSDHGRTVDVTVSTLAGDETLASAYTYADPPTLSGVSPGTAPRSGGTTVKVQGSNFVSGQTQVLIDGTAAGIVNVIRSEVEVTVPPAPVSAVGSPVDVSVTTPGGSDTLSGAFSYTT